MSFWRHRECKGTVSSNLSFEKGQQRFTTTNILLIGWHEGGGAEAPWSPQKWSPNLRICRITSRPRKTGLPASVTSPSLPPFCLHAPHFGSNKKYLAFISTKNLFLKNSQHDEIVQNDTLTFCIKKWILIEIKGLYFVFLNFTNSLNCEELLQFCIKID